MRMMSSYLCLDLNYFISTEIVNDFAIEDANTAISVVALIV